MIQPLQRRRHPRVVRWISQLPLWLLLVPLFRLLEWQGSWPRRFLGKGMKNFFVWPATVQPAADDVVVSSYFKSGTTWMLQIAAQIAWHGKAEFAHIHDLVPWPELPQHMRAAVDYANVDPSACPSGLRVVKTHFAPGHGVPWAAHTRYICVVRDPKSVFESSYPFFRNTGMGPLMPKPRNWLEMFLSDDALFGPWPDFTARCWALRNKPNVLFLTYEEMKNDLPGTVARVAAFMGVNLSASALAAVIEQAGFDYMKKSGHKFDPVGMGPPWATPEGAMVRKGASKSHGELMPGANTRIDQWCRARLQLLHSDFPYDSHYGEGK